MKALEGKGKVSCLMRQRRESQQRDAKRRNKRVKDQATKVILPAAF